MAYTVTLRDFPGLTPDARLASEQRFRRALDKALGDDALAVLQASMSVEESGANEMSKNEFAMASRWPKAYDLARTAGFRDLGSAEEAFFDVRATAD